MDFYSTPFDATKIDNVRSFRCGENRWEYAIAEWIKGDRVLKSMIQRGTEVWLYYDGDLLVGYGSLGKTRRKWLPPDGGYQNLSLIPSIAVHSDFQGKPDTKPRYSDLIIGDLIAKARDHGTELLVLDVHEENKRAIAFYNRYDFNAVSAADDHGYITMYHRLPSGQASI